MGALNMKFFALAELPVAGFSYKFLS